MSHTPPLVLIVAAILVAALNAYVLFGGADFGGGADDCSAGELCALRIVDHHFVCSDTIVKVFARCPRRYRNRCNYLVPGEPGGIRAE